jgi:polysaccharide biosynthesis transport protein
MNPTHTTVISPTQLLVLLRTHAKRWLVPAVAIAVVATVYGLVRTPSWEASQALMVRNEASNSEKSPGKFVYPEEMKNVQETILEVAKSRGVLAAALREVGPPANYKDPGAWPTEGDIVNTRASIKLAPPKGGEFGKTEVFYLNVRAGNRERSIALNEAIFKQLRVSFQELRDVKAQSMVDELTKTALLAKANLDRATTAIQATESRVGSDLAELRSMQDMAASDSALRRSAEEIRGQLRENLLADKTAQELLTVLATSQNDIGRFVAAPNRLLESHPSLRRLKDGLVDAQLRTSALLGTMSAQHPKVLAAKEAEEEIGRNLHNELDIARRGIEVELHVLSERRALLEDQLSKAKDRQCTIAAVRSTYANELAEVKSRATLLERAEQNLAEAQAARASAKAANLISRIDSPDTGIRPVGPGFSMIVLSGIFGGLLAGFGIVFLTVPLVAAPVASEVRDNGSVLGGNGSAKSPARGNERFSINRALHKLAS